MTDKEEFTSHSSHIEVENLVATQEDYLAQITKLWINFSKLAKTKRSSMVIRSRLESLQKLQDISFVQHNRLFALSDKKIRAQLSYFTERTFDSITEKVDEIRDNLHDALSQALIEEKATTSESSSLVPSEGQAGDANKSSHVDLKPINVRKFSGDYDAWTEYRDLFVTLVDSRKDLSDVQKLHYLKASVEGPAARLLRQIPVTETNYKTAWELLKRRYENPRAMLYSYFDEFLAVPKVGVQRSADLLNIRDSAYDLYTNVKGLSRPIHLWEDQFVHLILTKLDDTTRHAWELTLKSGDIFPTFEQLDEFLSHQLDALRISGLKDPVPEKRASSRLEKTHVIRSHQAITSNLSCFVCSGEHPLFKCAKFLEQSELQRIALLKSHERCLNCFRRGHRPNTCDNKNTCRICHKKHNTLVHVPRRQRGSSDSVTTNPIPVEGNSPSNSSAVISSNFANCTEIDTLLPTAKALIESESGRSAAIRALLDQGSQASFISESAVQLLKLPRYSVYLEVSGVGSKPTAVVRFATTFLIKPGDGSAPAVSIRAFVLPKLSGYVPTSVQLPKIWPFLENLALADSFSSSTEPIQLIIGSDYYGEFLLEGLRCGPPGGPIAQLTSFGWVVSGPSGVPSSTPCLQVNHVMVDDELDSSLRRFWELEEVPHTVFPTEEDVAAESFFQSSHVRLSSGRYEVRLPFKAPLPSLFSESRAISRKLYLNQEARLLKNVSLKVEYDSFLLEYLRLGHMEEIQPADLSKQAVSYLPHHPVVRSSSSSTKVRVVFNASFQIKKDMSLNSFLMVGPKLQADLFSLVLKWRCHRVVVATDIEKMFRQIAVPLSDADFQRIWWRKDPLGELKEYRLLTVTYGTACAPFLANRVILQLARDERRRFPEAAQILEESVYVDDLMFGADDTASLMALCEQVTHLLMAGGFKLHKWTSNAPIILSHLSSPEASQSAKSLGDDSETKILGVHWNPHTDAFYFSHSPSPIARTKREFLSMISRLFDPLGWVAPATIVAKIIIQTLWIRRIGWDDALPKDIHAKCQNFQEELTALSSVNVPRWTGQSPSVTAMELHGFCDASNAAYASVIYLRVLFNDRSSKVSLLFAKTKVAPLKIQSVPRLELCAATLLVRSVKFVSQSMNLTHVPVFCWSDSTVVLAWINNHPSRWKVFVANRVSEIHSLCPSAQWRHIPTSHNPADCASRGMLPRQLIAHPLWWNGPRWLRLDPSEWPQNKSSSDVNAESEARNTAVSMHTSIKTEWDLFDRVSSWPKLVRIYAYILRFISRIRRTLSSEIPVSSFLTSLEVRSSITGLCKLVQGAHFQSAINSLRGKSSFKIEKALLSLNPFLDSEGLVRVGGRLRNSLLPFHRKFPILLPDCLLSKLLIRHFHLASLHGGLQITLHLVRQSYWILRARSLVKLALRQCVVCARQRAALSSQLMGNLPSPRVTPSRPFSHTGIDYAGPFFIRSSKGRGHKTHKAYCVIFVCLSIRAIHLECADDCTTSGFIAAFNRFISRRGLPSDLYTDNGPNFVGADRELSADINRLLRDPDLRNRFASDVINWHFIPPAAPHFGGLWEAGVKSVKHHLKRIMGNFKPTFEEFSTLLCLIEATLNSRPLTPLHDDVDSLDALTPGHFLVGSGLKATPVPSVLELNPNRLSRWQTVQRLQESFWKVWSSDYLNSLQQRTKWRETCDNLKEGDLVLLRNSHLPPSKWELGRVSKTIPGQDERVRVVLVRTSLSEFKRPVTQLCKLPVDSHTPAPTLSARHAP